MSQISKHNQPFITQAFGEDGSKPKPGQELLDRVSSDLKVAAHSTTGTLSSDASFIEQLKRGDLIISHQAAANEVHPVVTDKTLPTFSGTNLLALCWRASDKASS